MSLPWVRLDTGFGDNPKVLDLVAERGWNAALDAVASARVRTLDASLLDALAALRKPTEAQT